jgi:hypothetical protein
VIVLIDDSEIYDDLIFQQTTKGQFLKGYVIQIQFMTLINY